MPLFETRDLAIYASVVGTLNGAWTLYHGVIRDRPRVVVRATQAEAITPGIEARQPVFTISVSNRGRRAITIDAVGQSTSAIRGTKNLSADILRQLQPKPRLDESESKTFVHGQMGGYQHGDLSIQRWYVTDGAGRIHPLRERFRQRVENLIFWPVRRFLERRERRSRL